MRAFVLGLAILAFSATLTACNNEKSAALAPVKTDPSAVEKRVAELAAETFVGKATAAADIAAVRDALPSAVSLVWSSLTFDETSKATVLTGVKLTPAETPDVGLAIDEMRLWDFDADFAKARLAGQRLGETASLASRIEIEGVRIFGIETLIAPLVECSTVLIQTPPPGAPTVDGIVESLVGSPEPRPLTGPVAVAEARENAMCAGPVSLDSYDFSIARIVIDDAMLRPYELALTQLPPEHEFAEAMPVLQTFAAVARTYAADTVAALGVNAEMAMTQMGQPMTFSMKADAYGLRGLRGGDTDAAFMRDINFAVSAPTSGTVASPTEVSISVDYASTQDTRLDKLYGYLARGEWPARTETDLLSIGLVELKNERVAFDGATLFSVGEVSVDARNWRWLVPTRLSIATQDAVYNVEAFIEFAEKMQAAELASLTADGETQPSAPASIDPAIMQLLTKYGLDKPSFDQLMAWDWNPDTGATVIDFAFGLDSYMRFDLKYEGGFPTFEGVSDLIPGGFETAKGEEIGALFETASTLKAIEFNLADEGGLDKVFALAAEAGKSLPPEATGGVAIFANATPQGLRQAASAGVYMAADQAAQTAPGLKELIAPFGAFIDKGGKVKFTLKPKAPVSVADILSRDDVRTGMKAPAELLLEFNGKTVHTPPPAAPN